MQFPRLFCVFVLLLFGFCFGCKPTAEIRSYTVAKEAKPQANSSASSATAVSSEPTHRMLAAIVPVGQQAWFLKTVGTLAEVEAVAEEIESFYGNLEITEGAAKPGWTLPDGWQEAAGQGMRAATLTIPSGESELELSVMKLPFTSTGPAGMLANVNRWRGQMKLPPVDAEGLTESTRQTEDETHPATIVDLAGVFGDGGMSGGMRAPFAGGTQSAADKAQLPADHPPIAPPRAKQSDSPPTAARAVPGAPSMDVPNGWQQGRLSTFRKAAYNIVDGDKKAEVTVMDFPGGTGSPMADPLANANRWRGQVGLEPLTADNLADNSTELKVDGLEGSYFELIPDAQATGILAAMVQRGNMMWFFKMTGDRELVTAQQENFRKLLASVKFDATQSGGSDGNN